MTDIVKEDDCGVTYTKPSKYGCFYLAGIGYMHNIKCPISKEMNKVKEESN